MVRAYSRSFGMRGTSFTSLPKISHTLTAPCTQPRRHTTPTRSSSQRQAKDPSSYASIEDLRRELEMAKGDPPFSITRSIKWLSDAANSSEVKSGKGARILAFQAYKFVLGMTPSPWMPPDLMDGAILSQIESTTDPDLLRQLEVLLLGSRQSTLKLLKRYPALRQMDINDVTIRMVTLKSLFPGSNVARMMELTPSAFLAAPWLETEKRLEKSSKLLREKLQGADLDFMFQEDPTILFEDIESLKIGLERLKDLWDVDEQAMANSEPLELALAVKALGLSGPPKKF